MCYTIQWKCPSCACPVNDAFPLTADLPCALPHPSHEQRELLPLTLFRQHWHIWRCPNSGCMFHETDFNSQLRAEVIYLNGRTRHLPDIFVNGQLYDRELQWDCARMNEMLRLRGERLKSAMKPLENDYYPGDEPTRYYQGTFDAADSVYPPPPGTDEWYNGPSGPLHSPFAVGAPPNLFIVPIAPATGIADSSSQGPSQDRDDDNHSSNQPRPPRKYTRARPSGNKLDDGLEVAATRAVHSFTPEEIAIIERMRMQKPQASWTSIAEILGRHTPRLVMMFMWRRQGKEKKPRARAKKNTPILPQPPPPPQQQQ